MAQVLKCEHCGQTARYDKSVIKMSGNVKTRNYSVPCSFCGKIINGSHTIEGLDEAIKQGRAEVISIDE